MTGEANRPASVADLALLQWPALAVPDGFVAPKYRFNTHAP